MRWTTGRRGMAVSEDMADATGREGPVPVSAAASSARRRSISSLRRAPQAGAGPLEQLVGVRVGGADEGEQEVEVGIGGRDPRAG